ncbi:hypothetical protein HQ571_04540 [Candidatus Kuenenbacteria bacterium]|nr:hypothetical protein [Candidatus Kuenenbacteria bacterium]
MKHKIMFLNFVILVSLFGCVLMINQVFAWTEPSASPPAGNVEAPINVSVNNQVKQGGLGILDIDPGVGYGLAVGSGTTGAIKTLNSKTNVEVNLNDNTDAIFIEGNKSSFKGINSQIDGINSYPGYFRNDNFYGVGINVIGKAAAATMFGDSYGLVVEAEKVGLYSKLKKSNILYSETKLNFFESGTNPIAVGAYNKKGNVEGYAELGLDGTGIRAGGKYFAGKFYGPVRVYDTLTTDKLIVNQDCTGCDGDLAEEMAKSGRVEAGDIVATDSDLKLIKASSRHKTVIGIISSNPSMTLNQNTEVDSAPVALSGIVPVNVNNENGSIEAGDFITASSVPGFGMKAVDSGTVVGKALEALDSRQGQIKIFVDLGWFGGTCKR